MTLDVRRPISLLGAVSILACVSAACTGALPLAGGASATASVRPTQQVMPPQDPSTGPALTIDESITPVSASKPGDEAASVLAKCNIGEQIPLSEVTGMGKVASASALVHYVPLTGREPQVKEVGPAWVITIHADLPQPGSTELWTDPTCVVTERDAGWYATGPVTNLSTGKTMYPERPSSPPLLRVPPLAP